MTRAPAVLLLAAPFVLATGLEPGAAIPAAMPLKVAIPEPYRSGH